MCGKFTQLVEWEDVFGFIDPRVVMPEDAPVRFATPMRMAEVIRLGEDGKREKLKMRWGFSKPGQASFKPDHTHARSETVDSRPTFTNAFVERRGILVVETFNEGEELPSGKTKQWVFSPKDRMPAILREEDWAAWLGETDASLKDIKALLRTFDDAGNWNMTEQAPSKPKPKPQMDLF